MKKIGNVVLGLLIPFCIFSQTFTEITIFPSGTYYPGGEHNAGDFAILNNQLVFLAADGSTSTTSALWKTDGTQAGTSIIKSPMYGHNLNAINSSWEHFLLNNKVYFRGVATFSNDPYGRELWVTDGTETGTMMVKDVYPGPENSRMERFTGFKGEFYFEAEDGIHGRELWKTDGTEAGTVMVADIEQGSISSSPDHFHPLGNYLIFRAYDEDHGRELWRTDGTEARTQLVKDIRPGTGNSFISRFKYFNGELYFNADDNIHGSELWKTDGTEAGTVMVKDIHPTSGSNPNPFNFIVYKNKLYFRANHPDYGNELWVTDGTETGTVLFKDINPGTAGSSTGPMFIFNDRLYFSADDGIHGSELWVSDGTPSGTMMAVDIVTGVKPSSPAEFIEYNGKMYFKALSNDTEYSLYESDGTEAGTHLLAPNDAIGNAHLDDPAYSFPRFRATVFNGALYFWANYYGTGSQLWKYKNEPTNTRTISNSTLQLYPNPATDHLYIDLEKFYSDINLEVHNINGQLIERKRLQSVQQHVLNVSQWSKGLYIISVISEEGVVNKKFIKQ